MSKQQQGPPPAAPPSYFEAVGGVPPANPYVPPPTGNLYTQQPQGGNAPQMIVTTVVPVGPGSTHMVCPHCHAEIDTAVRTEPGLLAWLSGGLLLLMGCWLGCCLIPCCIPECMSTHHNCPNCKAYLGRFSRF